MTTFNILASVALEALKLWNSKEATKYQDKIAKLQRERYEEENKPRGRRSDAVIDNLEFELRITCEAFLSARSRESNPKD